MSLLPVTGAARAMRNNGCQFLLAAFFALLLFGCTQGNEGPSDTADPANLVDLLPASTRGVMQMRDPTDTAPWLQDAHLAPWRQHPTDIVRHYLGQSSAAPGTGANVEHLVLGQTLAAEDGFIVIAHIAGKTMDLPGHGQGAAREAATRYNGYSLQPLGATALFQAWIDDKTLVIAPRRNLELVIQVHTAQAANIRQSAIAPYLEALDTTRPTSFVYGLPGLYREIVTPGSGSSSLRRADVAMAAFSQDSGRLSGTLQVVSNNAGAFTARLMGLLPGAKRGNITANEATLTIDLDGLSPGADIQSLLKTLFIDMDAVDYSEAIGDGGNAPWLNFDVGENPNSIFINFEFSSPVQRARFASENLPEGFTLAPIRIVDDEQPRYYLVLNIYQSSGGLVEGARAEWSVFVNDPASAIPRFLVIQAAAENISADSVNLVTPPEPVSHDQQPDAISSYVGAVDPVTGEQTTYFRSRINWPPAPETRVAFDREFAAANDYIYWGNAVADRGLYNASVYNRDAVLVAADAIELVDNSRWAQYVDAAPVHTLVYLNPLAFVISPWWNLDADYLDTTEDYRQNLVDFKNQFYPMTALNQAEAAVAGRSAALLPASLATSEPEIHYHFLLTDPEALFASVGVARQFVPAAIRLYDTEVANYYLTLTVYTVDGDPCGRSAEWRTYVTNTEGRPESLRLQTLSSDACLDADNGLGLPAALQHEIAGAAVSTRVLAAFFHIDIALQLDRSSAVLPGRNWLAAGDRVCSPGQVCDRFFYDGQLLQGEVQLIEPGDIDIRALQTPWHPFFQPDPVAVTVNRSPRIFATNPWHNVPGLGSLPN